MRDGDLMWDRGWYGDLCERRGLRYGTEDGVRYICEKRGLRCGTEDGMVTFVRDGDLYVGQRRVQGTFVRVQRWG